MVLSPLVTNFRMEFATGLQWRMDGAWSASPRVRVALANSHDHPEGIRMPCAEFHADLLKTKEYRTDGETHRLTIFAYVYIR